MGRIIKRYLPDGSTRAVWPNDVPVQPDGLIPSRASHVYFIDHGPFRGQCYVDMSPLAELTGDVGYCICLWPPQPTYKEACVIEVSWLETNWVRGDYHDYTDKTRDEAVL